MREIEEEEAVGEMSSFKDRRGRFLLPISLKCQVGIKWELSWVASARLAQEPA